MGDSITVGLDRGVLYRMEEDRQRFHTELQMDAFITAKAGWGHPYGMYLQALREFFARKAQMTEESVGIALDRLELEELRRLASKRAWTRRGRLDRMRSELAATRAAAALAEREGAQAERKRELKHFAKQAEQLQQRVGALTPARRRELDLDFWTHRMRCKVAIDFIREGRPSAALLEMLPHLPEKARSPIIHALEAGPADARAWFLELGVDLRGEAQETPTLC